MSASEILKAAKALPIEEQIEVAQELWYGIAEKGRDPDLTPEQAAELDRRLDEFEKNPADGIPWEQVKAEMKERFGWE